jgi:hypothetical protein
MAEKDQHKFSAQSDLYSCFHLKLPGNKRQLRRMSLKKKKRERNLMSGEM